jgi:2-dehydropantoate 2-reductase
LAQAQFVILGAGAMGSIVGAHLAQAGHSVLMLARGQRARQLREHGIRITGLSRFVQSVEVLSDPSQLSSAGVLIVATKTYGTEAALQALRHAHIGVALSMQNGLMKDEQLAEVFGAQCVLGALADTSGELLSSGEVLFTRNANLSIGELDGTDSERVRTTSRIIDASGVRSSVVNNIVSLEWCKFAAWTGMMALSVTTRAPSWKYLVDADAALVLARLVREVGTLATAAGVPLSDHSTLPVASLCTETEAQAVQRLQSIGEHMRLHAPEHRMSTLQDLLAGRPLETDETLGYAVRKATALGVRVPLLDAVYHLISGIGHARS